MNCSNYLWKALPLLKGCLLIETKSNQFDLGNVRKSFQAGVKHRFTSVMVQIFGVDRLYEYGYDTKLIIIISVVHIFM